MVTVPFHQSVRSLITLVTILINAVLFSTRYSAKVWLAMLILSCGVTLSTIGDYSWTNFGLILTLFSVIFAALKAVLCNRMMAGRMKIHPMELLMCITPLAFIQALSASYLSGELETAKEYLRNSGNGFTSIILVLTINGLFAFGMTC
jgi:hypothetical protein